MCFIDHEGAALMSGDGEHPPKQPTAMTVGCTYAIMLIADTKMIPRNGSIAARRMRLHLLTSWKPSTHIS